MSRVIVFHSTYGCETGCCGHVIEVEGENVKRFYFSHPDSRWPGPWPAPYIVTDKERIDFIRELVTEELGKEHVADIDWDACVVSGE